MAVSAWLWLLMSIFQPVSLAARRAFCPSLPMAKESWLSGTMTRAAFSFGFKLAKFLSRRIAKSRLVTRLDANVASYISTSSKLVLRVMAIIIAALILQVAGLGLNLGIDFTGGSILEYSVGENYDVADVEKILTEVGFTDAHITKAAPSAASEMLQAQRTTEEAAEPVLSDEDAAAVESGEAHVHADGTVHYGEHVEESVEATEAPVAEATEAPAE